MVCALTDPAAEAGNKHALQAGQARIAPQHASTPSSAQYHLRGDPVTGFRIWGARKPRHRLHRCWGCRPHNACFLLRTRVGFRNWV